MDAVALGLKRGPRGAVALVLLGTLAVVGGVLATRVSPEQPAPILEDELVALPALPPPSKTKPSKKKTPSPSGRGVGVRERTLAPKTELAPKPVVAQPETKAQEPAVEVAKVEEPLTLTPPPPPPPPAPEPEEEVAEPAAPAPVAVADEPPLPAASAAELIEVDGNGAAIAKLIAASKRAAVRACFESELKQTPKLRGTVVVELDLAPPNRVTAVRVSDDLERPAFTRCVRNTMQTIRFTGLDEELSVSVPYALTPQSK